MKCICGSDHRPVSAYGAWCCPDRLSKPQFGAVRLKGRLVVVELPRAYPEDAEQDGDAQ